MLVGLAGGRRSSAPRARASRARRARTARRVRPARAPVPAAPRARPARGRVDARAARARARRAPAARAAAARPARPRLARRAARAAGRPRARAGRRGCTAARPRSRRPSRSRRPPRRRRRARGDGRGARAPRRWCARARRATWTREPGQVVSVSRALGCFAPSRPPTAAARAGPRRRAARRARAAREGAVERLGRGDRAPPAPRGPRAVAAGGRLPGVLQALVTPLTLARRSRCPRPLLNRELSLCVVGEDGETAGHQGARALPLDGDVPRHDRASVANEPPAEAPARRSRVVFLGIASTSNELGPRPEGASLGRFAQKCDFVYAARRCRSRCSPTPSPWRRSDHPRRSLAFDPRVHLRADRHSDLPFGVDVSERAENCRSLSRPPPLTRRSARGSSFGARCTRRP